MRTSIWLIRHAQTELNRQRRYQGCHDIGLTAFGEQQARALAFRLRQTPFHSAIISPSQRTRATAATVLGKRATTAIFDQRWAETRHGRWEGLTYREVQARFPNDAAARFSDPLHGRAPGGESLHDVYTRVIEAWNELLREQAGGRVLVATHATPIQLVLCAITGMEPSLYWRWRIDLASLTAIDLYGSSPIVRVVNEVPKLSVRESHE